MKIDHYIGKVVFQLSFFSGYVKLRGVYQIRKRFAWSIDMSVMCRVDQNVVWMVMIDGKCSRAANLQEPQEQFLSLVEKQLEADVFPNVLSKRRFFFNHQHCYIEKFLHQFG